MDEKFNRIPVSVIHLDKDGTVIDVEDYNLDKAEPDLWALKGLAASLLPVWGDRIFEKCGIRRDEGGDGGKTLEIRGKRRLSARDRGANYQQS